MNEFVEAHGVYTIDEFISLVNEHLKGRGRMTRDEAVFYAESGMSVGSVVEEWLHFHEVYGNG